MRADPRRVRAAELIALLAALTLATSLFLPWFELAGGARVNAWSALTVTELPLALAALLGIALFAVTLWQRTPALPVALAVFTALAAGAGALAAIARALVLPAGAVARCYGLWLGLAAVIVLFAAACYSMRDERPFRGVSASTPAAPS
jgi:hypothetical protein